MKNLRIFCKFPILKNLENFENFGKFLKGFLKNKCAAGEMFFEKKNLPPPRVEKNSGRKMQ